MDYDEIINDELIIVQIDGYSVNWIDGLPKSGVCGRVTITLAVDETGEDFLIPELEALRRGEKKLVLRIQSLK